MQKKQVSRILKDKEIVLGLSASIAIYKSCALIRRLQEEGAKVTVIMTKEAQELIRPVVFAALSRNRVYTDMFNLPDVWEIEHVSLAEKADALLIAPATANIIAKLAAGICDDLLTCVVYATKAPILLAPAMHENMFLHKITQANIKKLKEIGYRFIPPREGRLASGRIGQGCLADIEEIIQALKKAL